MPKARSSHEYSAAVPGDPNASRSLALQKALLEGGATPALLNIGHRGAAARVAGVTAVANDIEVRLPGVDQRPDPEIARDAVASIKTQLPVSWEQIKVVVKDGWMTLERDEIWQNRGIPESAGI
jgi:hypothetical protein